MEHIDALEAVRRLTLERDALAEQLRRLKEQAATRIRERDDAVQRANHAENEASRLTLERDALAEQVRRLEDSVVWHREELERTRAEWEQQENALQAPERHERHETGKEPTEGTNGAPRGCMVPSCLKCLRLWEECDRLSRSIGWGTIAQK